MNVNLDERESLSVGEVKHLFGGRLRQESGDDEVDKASLAQDVEDEEVAVADRTAPILHLVHCRLRGGEH